MIKFELEFPDKDFSPNARVHWSKLYKKKRNYRMLAYWIARANNWNISPERKINIRLDFYPKANRAYDIDNLQASMKPALDGMADGWGVNDKLFQPGSYIQKKDGRPRVEVTAWQD